MKIEELFAPTSSIFLLLAPPAWGKTSLLLDLYERGEDSKMIFISPLRALANEFFARGKDFGHMWMPKSRIELKEKLKSCCLKKKFFLILTPELLGQEMISMISDTKVLYVFDEFHLFYRWGHSFREKMWETLMGVANSGNNILALSATMEPEILELWKNDFRTSMDEGYILDCGNLLFKYYPAKISYMGGLPHSAIYRHFFRLSKKRSKGDGTWLLFCAYRSQVESITKALSKRGFRALGCVGGETLSFVENLKKYPRPDFIIATIALSHGVNLPEITKVFNGVTNLNRDMWLQMAARGGRAGAQYELFTLQSFDLTNGQKIKDSLYYGLIDGFERLQGKFKLL